MTVQARGRGVRVRCGLPLLASEEATREGHYSRRGGARLPPTLATGADGRACFVTGILLKACRSSYLRAQHGHTKELCKRGAVSLSLCIYRTIFAIGCPERRPLCYSVAASAHGTDCQTGTSPRG